MDHRKYVPVLKWKMGEYQALARLSEEIKSRVVPLIEVPPAGFDFETKQVKKTPSEHLKDFGKKLNDKWQDRNCLLDLKYFDPKIKMGSQHYVNFIFDQTIANDCGAIPVLSLQSDEAFLKAVAKIPSIEESGIAIRLANGDFDNPQLADQIKDIGKRTGVGWGETDVIVDLCRPEYIPKTVFRGGLAMMLASIPQLNKARSMVVIGTSYPKVLAEYKDKEQHVPRMEWIGYKDFVGTLDEQARIPTFGDYAVAHPDLVELDMRFVTPYAKLRYTLEDSWYLAIGKAVRTEGFEQYRDMCKSLIKQPFFDGPNFSAGDEYIDQCAKGKVKTGNLSTWVWVANNRHITKTLSDLSSFFDL